MVRERRKLRFEPLHSRSDGEPQGTSDGGQETCQRPICMLENGTWDGDTHGDR